MPVLPCQPQRRKSAGLRLSKSLFYKKIAIFCPHSLAKPDRAQYNMTEKLPRAAFSKRNG